MNANELKFRLSKVLKESLVSNYKSKSKLAIALDSNATSISQYMDDLKTFPQADFIYNLCRVLSINPTWLIFGIGEKELKDESEILGNESKNVSQKIGNNNSNIIQIMHSNDILHSENESLKRENTLLREMVELYKNQSTK